MHAPCHANSLNSFNYWAWTKWDNPACGIVRAKLRRRARVDSKIESAMVGMKMTTEAVILGFLKSAVPNKCFTQKECLVSV